MIHFVAIAGSSAAILTHARQLLPAVMATRFFTGDEVEWIDPLGRGAFAAIAAPDPAATRRWGATDDAFVAVNGPAFATADKQPSLIADALRSYTEGGTEEVARALTGTYNFVGFAPRFGLAAFTDYSGLYPLYWSRLSNLIVISNRSTTVARVAGSTSWDLHALAWVISRDTMLGDHMPAGDVRHLSPWEELRVTPDGRLSVERARSWIWPPPDAEPGRNDLTSQEWDDLTDRLVAETRSLGRVTEPIDLYLTGGKDSRLCLALVKAAGLQGRVRTLTTGDSESREVAYARVVAQAAGFEHRRVGKPALASGPGTQRSQMQPRQTPPAAIWKRLAAHAYRHEAIVSPWDLAGGSMESTINIKGFGGAYYRRSHLRWFSEHDATTLPAMTDRIVRMNWDPLRVLRSRESARQAAWLREWVEQEAARVRLDLLPEKYYADFRLAHWNGPLTQSRPGEVQTNPLFQREATQTFIRLSVSARQQERFHYEVMRRAAPELVALPFLDDSWPTGRDEEAVPATTATATPAKAGPRPRALGTWQWHFLATEERAIEQLFKDARKTEMSAICNMRRLRRIARNAATIDRVMYARSLLSAINVAIVLLGRSEPVLDPVDVDTGTPPSTS
jgi:hypothetical protein